MPTCSALYYYLKPMHSSVHKKNRDLTDLITSLIIANGQMGGIKSKTTGFPAIFSLPGHAQLALPTGLVKQLYKG